MRFRIIHLQDPSSRGDDSKNDGQEEDDGSDTQSGPFHSVAPVKPPLSQASWPGLIVALLYPFKLSSEMWVSL